MKKSLISQGQNHSSITAAITYLVDLGQKCCIAGKIQIPWTTGRTPRRNGTHFPLAEDQAGHELMDRSQKPDDFY